MTLGEAKQRRDLLQLHIVYQGDYSPCLLQPITLPKLARTDALEDTGLVVTASCHGPAVDGIDNAVLREEPQFIAPFGGIAVFVGGVVVVDEVEVADVSIEGRI